MTYSGTLGHLSSPLKLARARALPQQFSWTVTLLLTVLLLMAEHHSAASVHGGLERDFQLEERGGQLLRQIAYLGLGGLGWFAWRKRAKSNMSPAWNKAAALPLLALLLWCCVSITWSADPLLVGKRIIVLMLLCLGASGLVLFWSRRTILFVCCISSAVQVSVGIVAEISNGLFVPTHGDYRFGGTLTWNEQGMLCLVLFTSSLALAFAGGRGRVIFSLLAAYGGLFLVLTRSRGSLIGMGLVMLIFVGMRVSLQAKVALVIFGGLLGSLLLVSGAVGKVADFASRGGEGADTLTGRGPLWDDCLQYVAKRPLAGAGYEDFWTPQTIDDISDDQHWPIAAAHSAYIESLLTLGAIGLVLHTATLLGMLVSSFMLFRRTRDSLYCLSAAFALVYLAVGGLESVLLIKPSPVSFFVAMLLAAVCVAPERDQPGQADTSRIRTAPGFSPSARLLSGSLPSVSAVRAQG